MKGFWLIAALLTLHTNVSGQKQVAGRLADHTGQPLPHITVLLKNNGGKVVAFAYSDQQGQYRFSLPDSLQLSQLYLEISNLSYEAVKQVLQPGRENYDFSLVRKVVSLPEVKTRNKPVINSRGDTLSYNVSSFSREEDRSIGDVIKRLPGLTVGENGMIYYNGRPIFNLYIDGDNLMDGRYQLATKAVNKDMIKSIEVIQNHQPVKVLQDKVATDNVALNLVLKDENSIKLSGQVMAGAGLPGLFDTGTDLILLNKKIKMINSLKANNTGIDYTGDIAQFGASSFLDETGNTRPKTLLSAGTAASPDIPRKNFYFNRSGLVSINNLFNTKRKLQWRLNMQLLVDRNRFNYASMVDNYLGADTIRYYENQSSVRKPYQFNTALNLMINKQKYYLNNTLRLNFAGERNASNMDLNGHAFYQYLRSRTFDISNHFNWTPAVKKGIISINWYVNSYNNPQRLRIDTGLNADLLNEGLPFEAILQKAATPTLFSHVYVSYMPRKALVSQTYEVGYVQEEQDLNSTLSLLQSDATETVYKGDAGNALRWSRSRFYLNPVYRFGNNRWQLRLSLPLIQQGIHYRQKEYLLNEKQRQFLFNPTGAVKLMTGAENYVELSYSYTNNVGNISGIYRGAILTNYRSLFANDAALQERYSTGPRLFYNFQRSISMLFINAVVSYNKIRANSILSSILTDNVQKTVLLPYSNDQSAFQTSAGISKYIFALKTTASLKAGFNKGRYEQYINNELLPFYNTSREVAAGVETKLFKKLSVSYNGAVLWSSSKLRLSRGQATGANKMLRLQQNLATGYSVFAGFLVNAKATHIYSRQPGVSTVNYVFLDLNARYRLAKWRTDLELDVCNIANQKTYELYSLSSAVFSANRYDIRQRLFILRATFNL